MQTQNKKPLTSQKVHAILRRHDEVKSQPPTGRYRRFKSPTTGYALTKFSDCFRLNYQIFNGVIDDKEERAKKILQRIKDELISEGITLYEVEDALIITGIS